MKRQQKTRKGKLSQTRVGAIAGIAAAVAYVVEQEVDLRMFDHDADDLVLLGGLFTRQRHRARSIGLGMHLANGAIAGIVYARYVHDRLPGPPVLRGVTFALVETTAIYPLALLEDYHPAIRRGELSRYWNGTAFAQSILRHIALGAVLGSATARLHRH